MSQSSSPNNTPFTRAHVFVIILLFILVLFFHENPIIQTVLAILGIGTFEPIFNPILNYCERWILKPLERFWDAFLRRHLTSFNRWFKSHHRFITTAAPIFASFIVISMTTGYPFVAGIAGSINTHICLYTSLPWNACSSPYGISSLPYENVRVGLIDDEPEDPFDQSAMNQDESEIETLIFRENQRACAGRHITLIAVTTLSRTTEDPASSATIGLQNLQGDYIAQHMYNNAGSPSIDLCLVIANLGTQETADSGSPLVHHCPDCYSVPRVFNQMALLARSDPSVSGIIGFPLSQQVIEALSQRQEYPSLANLPIISPTASSDRLSSQPNFYSVDAPNEIQANAIAQYFCHLIGHAKVTIALLQDNQDAYSANLSDDFSNIISKQVCESQVTIVNSSAITYTIGNASSIQQAVRTALGAGATYIFFSGYDQDLDILQSAIYNTPRNSSSTITILGGDGLNNVDATTYDSYFPIYAASFDQVLPQKDPFAQEYKKLSPPELVYYHSKNQTDLWIPKDVLLANDAVQIFARTLSQRNQTNPIPIASVSFTGISGPISFPQYGGPNTPISNRMNETVNITSYDQQHNLNLDVSYCATISTNAVYICP